MRLLLLSLLSLAGCYELSPDDELRSVPATNNPHLIQDPERSALPMTGF